MKQAKETASKTIKKKVVKKKVKTNTEKASSGLKDAEKEELMKKLRNK